MIPKAEFLRGLFAENFLALLLRGPWKAVRGSARLVGAATEQTNAGGFEAARQTAMHCSFPTPPRGRGPGPNERRCAFRPTRTSPDGVGILKNGVFFFSRSRLTSLYGFADRNAFPTTPDIDSSTPKSIEPLLPVMPMAVRSEPGIRVGFQTQGFDPVADGRGFAPR